MPAAATCSAVRLELAWQLASAPGWLLGCRAAASVPRATAGALPQLPRPCCRWHFAATSRRLPLIA
eukprot:13425795-Alexandrium_andersonii.AAC.1